ncbi:DUF3180 domain-containing protein [Diaminobutyricibacter tongyongensis]|uniref:DUF3180 domain-containing protein n=1 Tax=Leifsonia tongyongensis TaxID=1268043 RepID=A0A6L9XTK1_9MICO|nr:DUF3180 domain-containing protein [Diaminobutyricibacter tongyongensis]
MKRTRPTPLIGLGVAGLVIGFLVELGAAGAGLAVFIPPLSLPITLVAIAVIVIAFAIPIRRATHSKTRTRIDPFRAMRVAVLAKACSLSGALLTGSGIGVLAYLLSRSVLPASGAIWQAVAATVGAAILLAAGLVAEYLCTLPPEDDDTKPEGDHARAT